MSTPEVASSSTTLGRPTSPSESLIEKRLHVISCKIKLECDLVSARQACTLWSEEKEDYKILWALENSEGKIKYQHAIDFIERKMSDSLKKIAEKKLQLQELISKNKELNLSSPPSTRSGSGSAAPNVVAGIAEEAASLICPSKCTSF